MRCSLAAALLAAALPLSACLKDVPTAELAAPTDVAVALVIDHTDRATVSPFPDRAAARVTEALRARNLVPRAVPFEAYADAYAQARTTERRLALLAELAHDAPYVLLVEATPTFFSQLTGRYRWEVDARSTVAARGALEDRLTSNAGLATFLTHDHERERAAVDQASVALVSDLSDLIDRYFAGRPPPETTRARPAPPHIRPLPGRAARYFAMVDRFHDGDPTHDADVDPDDPAAFHGGDLRGLADKVPYLSALGVDALWISPISRMRAAPIGGHGAFHGYWTEDLGALEPRMGTEADLRALRAALDGAGIGLYLDVVLNHVGYDAPLRRAHPGWFHGRGDIEDWGDPEQLTTHDVHGLPDLDQDHPEVYRYLRERSLVWLDRLAPEGFRLDAVKHIGERFWRRYLADVRAHAGPDFVLLGELLEGDPVRAAAFAQRTGFRALFDFPVHFGLVDVFCRDAHPGRLAALLSLDRLYPAGTRLVTLLDNHDLPRVTGACGGDLERVATAIRFMAATRGTPSFTWGTELAFDALDEPHNRPSMRFDVDAALADVIRDAIAARRAAPALSVGHSAVGHVAADVIAVARWTEGRAAYVIYNAGDVAQTVPWPAWIADQLDADGAVTAPPGVSVTAADARPHRALTPPPSTPRPVTMTLSQAPDPPAEVRVVGGAPELGAWDVTAAPALDPARPLRLPPGVYDFKLAAFVEGGAARFERGDNRYLVVPATAPSVSLSLRFRGS